MIWFVSAHKQTSDPAQNSYELWLDETIPKIKNPKLDSRPAPEITLKALSQSRNINWELTLNYDLNRDKVIRLLEMLKEAKIISSKPVRNPILTMRIVTNSDSFTAEISDKGLENNEKAQSLLKLFQVYANP